MAIAGNQRRTHILQEDIHHDEHENKCFDQGLDNLVDRSEQEVIGTLCNIYLQTGRQRFGCFAEHLFQVADCLRCIGSGHLVYDTGHSLVAVYRIVEVIGQTSELYVGNVFHAKHFAVLKSLDNDVLKLLRLLETAFVADGVLETLVTAFTKLAGGRLQCFVRPVRRLRRWVSVYTVPLRPVSARCAWSNPDRGRWRHPLRSHV